MNILDLKQGSLDWHTERLWRLTASNMSKVITGTGKLSESQSCIDHIDRMIAGRDCANEIITTPEVLDGMEDWQVQKWIANFTGDKFTGNNHTQRGNEQEEEAIAALSDKLGEPIERIGMVVMGDNPDGIVSCSPDGVIYHDGVMIAGAEVKCPTLATWYGYVADGNLPQEYALQVHASMAICEVDLWHFAAYFRGKPLFHIPVKRTAYTDKIAESLHQFTSLYMKRHNEIREGLKLL